MWPEGFNKPGISDIKVFYASQTSTATDSWQTWTKPPGTSMINIFMIAAGGGGGKSNDGSVTVGSGSGGSGGTSTIIVPAMFLPDILYIRPGQGGLGATVAGNGIVGSTSYISIMPDTSGSYLVTRQTGGNGGLGVNSATPGAGGDATLSTVAIFQSLGLWLSQIGVSGTSGGGTNGSGSNLTTPTTYITTGGTGGGNGTGSGGAITASGPWPQIAGGVGTTGGNGTHGFRYGLPISNFLNSGDFRHLVFTGGTGGGGHTTGQAGNGGNGSYGGGGGGGGSCTSAGGLAGNGGNGGDGLVIITAW